jgi:hypothetical protein
MPNAKECDMNDGSKRGGRGKAVVLALAAVAGTVLLATGCSSSPQHQNNAGGGGGASSGTRYQQAVAYAACIRQHGVPAFPDPNSQGVFPNSGGLDLSSAQFKAAAAACKSLEPSPNTSRYQAGYQQLLKYSACMRSHGITSYPDPTLSDSGVTTNFTPGTGPGEIDTSSAQFKSASTACQSLEPGGH